MSRWDWFVLGTIAVVPFLAYVDGFFLVGTQEYYFHYLVLSYAEAFGLAVGYMIGKGVKHT